MKLVIINGQGGVGKDTFVEYCRGIIGEQYSLNISTIGFVKEMAKRCGWTGEKTEENRKFLSDLKDILTQWDDVPYKKVIEAIKSWRAAQYCDLSIDESEMVVFVHCREPQEIAKFVRETNAITVLIRRPAVERTDWTNHADAEVFDYNYDHIITNDGDLNQLRLAANYFVEVLKNDNRHNARI